MGFLRTESWPGNPAAPRAVDRRLGTFLAYVPHRLIGWHPLLPANVAAFVADAERQLVATASVLAPDSASVSMFFWAESLGSSRIEGVSPQARRVVHALIAEASPSPPHRRGSVGEAIGNIEATSEALRILVQPAALTVELLCDAHRVLMDSSPNPRLGGVLKTTQNWVGGNDWHPLDSDFVPPPPDECRPLMEDLVSYLRTGDHSPVLQAVVGHAQFETIHPFGDGNGRAGRALLYAALRHRCASEGFMPPISLALSQNRDVYLRSLAAYQSYVGAPDDAHRSAAIIPLLEVVSTAVNQSCEAASSYANAVSRLQDRWRERVGQRTGRSAALAAVNLLVSQPSLTPELLAAESGFSQRRCADALRRLTEAGITRSRRVGPRLRAYDADHIFDMYDVMSSTMGDPQSARQLLGQIADDPFLRVDDSDDRSGVTESVELGAKWDRCPLLVRSTGQRCGLAAGHRGHCRAIPQRRHPPRTR
ncbi:Fic family protein [Candidatus Poriferisodalis sp.]|uniref:Fic family protein n=1 Tax=Candidatus Poriferisodalis sp. TaxID=3101277 RepID=UPI003C6F23B7